MKIDSTELAKSGTHASINQQITEPNLSIMIVHEPYPIHRYKAIYRVIHVWSVLQSYRIIKHVKNVIFTVSTKPFKKKGKLGFFRIRISLSVFGQLGPAFDLRNQWEKQIKAQLFSYVSWYFIPLHHSKLWYIILGHPV